MRSVLVASVLVFCCGCGGSRVQRAEVARPAAPKQTLAVQPLARTFVVDPARSSFLIFGSDLFGGEHRMSFATWKARVELDPTPRIDASIDTASVEVDTAGATGIVRKHILEVDRFPVATLVAGLARTNGPPDEHVVDGVADLHGVKKNLRFVGRLQEVPGGYRFRTEFILSRKDFGIHYAPVEPFLRNDVRIVIDAFALPE